MSNASLKDQLQAVAGQLSVKVDKSRKVTKKSSNPKPAWFEYVQYGVELLQAYYPKCFFPMDNVKPLKKGIKQDLVKKLSQLIDVSTEDKACMVKSLSYYVNTLTYLKKVVVGTSRIDLDGDPVEEITPEEATYSSERLQTKIAARKKTQKQSSSSSKEVPASA